MLKQHALLPLFQKFISNTKSGKRLNKNGTRIKPQTIENYVNTKKLLLEFSMESKTELLIFEVKGSNKREHTKLKKYWANFYKQFTGYLYKQRNCHDNYVGQNIKHIRTFFNWVNDSNGMPTGPYHKSFYVPKEEVEIYTLTTERLKFLAFNKVFEDSLSEPLKCAKDVFMFGCMVGLRYSDLYKLKKQNIEERDGKSYLKVRSQKTGTDTLVKFPTQGLEIIKRYENYGQTILPVVSLLRFNTNMKKIAELAGWVEPVLKIRSKRGIKKEKKIAGNKTQRFCDLVSSHMIRRTSITIMLTSGMPEYVVRKISGHTSDSKAFYRYVNLAQSLMDKEIEKMHLHFEQIPPEISI